MDFTAFKTVVEPFLIANEAKRGRPGPRIAPTRLLERTCQFVLDAYGIDESVMAHVDFTPEGTKLRADVKKAFARVLDRGLKMTLEEWENNQRWIERVPDHGEIGPVSS